LVTDPHHPPTWQNQLHGNIRTAHMTYVAVLKTTTHPETRVCKILSINSTEKYFNHTTHPLPLCNLPPH
jgi:hypothetical protein